MMELAGNGENDSLGEIEIGIDNLWEKCMDLVGASQKIVVVAVYIARHRFDLVIYL